MTEIHEPDHSWLDLVAQEHIRKTLELEIQNHQAVLHQDRWDNYRKALETSPAAASIHLDASGDTVKIGKNGALSLSDEEMLKSSLQDFCPWKKGPFDVFGIEIDAEWRSQIKWNRIEPHLPSLENKVIADIGCHNGYFMFKMAQHNPKAVIGLEPVGKHWFNFQLLNKYAGQKNLYFELFGVEDTHLFPGFFDIIFCMGILYHHTDPIGLLRQMKLALGDESLSLTPNGRYAGAKGIWFLPTLTALETWIKRAGLQSKVIYSGPLTPSEQRASEWADIKSLEDFLSKDQSETIEGYPPPHRFYLAAYA